MSPPAMGRVGGSLGMQARADLQGVGHRLGRWRRGSRWLAGLGGKRLVGDGDLTSSPGHDCAGGSGSGFGQSTDSNRCR